MGFEKGKPPQKVKAAGRRLPRLRQYRTLINGLITLKRKVPGQRGAATVILSGSVRAMLTMWMAYLDAYDYPEVQTTLLQVIGWMWGGGRTRDRDRAQVDATAVIEEARAGRSTPLEVDAAEQIKSVFDQVLKASKR